MNTTIIESRISDNRKRLLSHPLYNAISNLGDLQVFTSHHVFAVWDFMSLLKALQRELTCTTTPWFPKGSNDTRYLINEIVLAEESDLDQDGNRLSHFEMYLNAMEGLDVDTDLIVNQIVTISNHNNPIEQISKTDIPDFVKRFLTFTFEIIERNQPHEIAAAFTYGREDLIPEMFTEILKGMRVEEGVDLTAIRYYFDRHIELDGDEHGPMAHKMVALLCGDDSVKWEQAAHVANESLQKRIELFDGIYAAIGVPELV
ncbi:probable remnant of a transposase gene protein [Nonlabens tegetincola]|uniref:Probable remnant of a transposase gene protein n=1 Tax=Nonlabens tegetincola TaxID=323273 RepID=A0A090Q019_9FLAO|nr:DUF3050 domain-containing protein [Nonlabens tegetincola]ARN70192.1 heme oxygenase [Nonlabens tegetincola]MEE2802106.1 DUF3050 domain-containing protein [Bacteroidota bacterium]PQJ19058.1 heme oxygenase [Nonlabens tegetincola]GAK95492.1 probable remnant of a transposase gene protein [Nonlabens tegetincola]